MDIVTVRVARPEASQVVLWERHPGHPTGEVFLAGAGSFEVGLTPAVKARLQDGRLVVEKSAVAEGKSVAAVAVEPVVTAPPADAPETEPEPAKPRKRAARKGGL
jgi:hypothetical protein